METAQTATAQDDPKSDVNGEKSQQKEPKKITEDNINEKEIASEFREIDINGPSGGSINNVAVPASIGLSVVENKTSSAKRSSFKEWSRSTLVYTKQLLSENFGFGTKTVDIEIERHIDELAESKKMCNLLIPQCQNISKCLASLTLAQKELGFAMGEISLKETNDFKQEMACTGEMFRALHKTTCTLEGIVNMFLNNLDTLSNKTMEDCIQSIRQYDGVRLEYDAYRVQYEDAKASFAGDEQKLKEVEEKFQGQLTKFNRTRADICTKMKLVEENKNKVLKRNLMILQEALAKHTREAGDSLGLISSHYDFRPAGSRSWLESE